MPHRDVIVRCEVDGRALVSRAAIAEADGDPFLGATIAERYVIIERLGSGSMGTVYRARQEAMGRDVAIKILRSDRAFDSQAKARFAREARAMSLLASRHTVTVFDFGETPDPKYDDDDFIEPLTSLFLAMELLEGESLGQRLKRDKRLPPPVAVRIAIDALRSLSEAHDKGIIHRDLKPDNLILTHEPGQDIELCKVLDFGIAKVMREQPTEVDALETQAGTVFGTPRYMSPEQAQAKTLDARSDLYALGVLLYQMLVGHPPFIDDDAVVVMAHHIKTVPEAPRRAAPDARISRALNDLVMRALAKNPDDRPGSARAFIDALDALLPGLADPALIEDPTTDGGNETGEMAAVARSRSDRPSHGLGLGRIAMAVGATAVGVSIVGLVALNVLARPAQNVAERGVASAALALAASAARRNGGLGGIQASRPTASAQNAEGSAEAADDLASAQPVTDAPPMPATAQGSKAIAPKLPAPPKGKDKDTSAPRPYERFE